MRKVMLLKFVIEGDAEDVEVMEKNLRGFVDGSFEYIRHTKDLAITVDAPDELVSKIVNKFDSIDQRIKQRS